MTWRAANPQQTAFLKFYEAIQRSLPDMPELQAWAKPTAREINQILAQNGFSIRLDDWGPEPGAFGTAGIIDITVEWLREGGLTRIREGEFDAVTLPDAQDTSTPASSGGA